MPTGPFTFETENIFRTHNVFPTFLNFKVSSSSLRRSKAYVQCKSRLLSAEIQTKNRQFRRLTVQLHKDRQDLRERVGLLDFTHLTATIDRQLRKRLKRTEHVQDSKLRRLRLQGAPSNAIDPDNVIFNLSSRQLTHDEKLVLSKGLDYSFPPSKLLYTNYLEENISN